MPLQIQEFHLGPLQNNSFLIADADQKQAIIIDAPAGSPAMAEYAQEQGWQITGVYLTHAHFDHITGVSQLLDFLKTQIPVALHPLDLPLWRQRGGAPIFGLFAEQQPDPTAELVHEQLISVGIFQLKVLHTPGHTPGHVVFYSPDASVAFSGDLIFYHSVGRTDLPAGNTNQLLNSIRESILTLPPNTKLFSGHGPATTVEEEMLANPFLS